MEFKYIRIKNGRVTTIKAIKNHKGKVQGNEYKKRIRTDE